MINNGKLVAVIPVFNEEENIKNTIKYLKKVNYIDEIIVVNDGSTDKTEQIVSAMGVKIISLKENYGKGYAIKKALFEINYDYLLLVDGDLGRSSIDVVKIIEPIACNLADVTVAKFNSPKKRGGFGLVKNLSKYGIYILTGKIITSSLSGQRVYKKSVIESLRYIPNNFGLEVAMTVGTIKNGFIIKEVPVNMTHRETCRDIKGFIHRGRQFLHISITFLKLVYRR